MINPDLPLVSVCIPSYNRATRLRRAVEKLLAGTYPNLEIIISDNGSTDGTQEVAAALCQASPRVRYFRHPQNQGPTRNFEFARSRATGKYFLWHGDDDYLSPDYIRLCVQELEKDPSLVLASGLAAYHAGDEVVTRYGNVINAEAASPLRRMMTYIFSVEENSIFCGAYRRASVAHCTFPNVLAGDWAWMSEVLAEGRARVLPQALVYRDESDNSSSSLERNVAILGVPAWHAKASWLAIPLNLANYLGFRAARMRSRFILAKLWRWLIIFSVAFLKQMVLWVGPKIPGVPALYRALFATRNIHPPRAS